MTRRRTEPGDWDPRRTRTVLLDLDGTLVDSKELILSSFRHTLRIHRGEVPPDSVWLASMGRPLEVQLREFAEDEAEVGDMVETYLEHNQRIHDERIRPFPDVREVVRELRRRGLRLAVVTSKRRDGTLRGLERCGYPRSWFGTLVTASDVDRPKPDPGPVLQALEEVGEPDPSRTVFVGDSVHDMMAGRRAGVGTAAALWGPYSREELAPTRPDAWLDRPSRLLDLLETAADRRTEASGPR